MLVNRKLQRSSYITSQKVADTLNSYGTNLLTLKSKAEEDGQCDGFLSGFGVEMKQRQNYYIEKVYNHERPPYDETTIHKSATKHDAKIFMIYDKSCRYSQIFLSDDIDTNDEITRKESTEIGNQNITYVTVPTSKTFFVDLKNQASVDSMLLWLSGKLQECTKI